MDSGVRWRLIYLIFAGLFVTMGLLVTCRHYLAKQTLFDAVRSQAKLTLLVTDRGDQRPLFHDQEFFSDAQYPGSDHYRNRGTETHPNGEVYAVLATVSVQW